MSHDYDSEPKAQNLYYVIPAEVMDSDILPLAKLCYGILSGYAHRDGTCWPSDIHLAKRLGCKERHANELIKVLTHAGFITKYTIPHPKNKFRKLRIITIVTDFKKSLRTAPQCGLGNVPQCTSGEAPECGIVSKEDSNVRSSPNPADSSKSSSSKPKTTVESDKMAQKLYDRVKANFPKIRPPDLSKWSCELRLMNERDKISWTDIEELIDWSTKDSFWMKNILSACALRKQYDKLYAQMRTSPTRKKYKPDSTPRSGWKPKD